MPDIHSLYTLAKTRGYSSDIKAYEEAVNSASPAEFVSNRKYIIQSSIGANSLKPFSEKYGLSIPLAIECETILESNIEKCKEKNLDYSVFESTLEWLKDRRKKYSTIYSMYEFYSIEDTEDYLEAYYSNVNGKQNRYVVSNMLDYSEEAVPDLFINSIENRSINTLLEYLQNNFGFNNGLFCEWVYRGLSDFVTNEHLSFYKENCCSKIAESYSRKKYQAFRESVITQTDMNVNPPTFEERVAISECIQYNEFMLTESTGNEFNVYKKIMSLYEDSFFDGSNPDGKSEDNESDDNNDTKTDEKPPKDNIEDMKPVICILKGYYTKSDYNKEIKKDPDHPEKYAEDPFPIIHKISRGDNYGHAAIAFDLDLNTAYDLMPYGVSKLNFDKDETWRSTRNLSISIMWINSENHQKIINECDYLATHKDEAHYMWSDFIKAYIGKPNKVKRSFICSGFVGYLLAMDNVKNINRDYARSRPEDLMLLPRAYHLTDTKDITTYKDSLDEIKRKAEEIKSKHKVEIEENNNELPKLMISNSEGKPDTIDKVFNFFAKKVASAGPAKMEDDEDVEESYDFIEYESDPDLEWFTMFNEEAEEIGVRFDSYQPLGNKVIQFLMPVKQLIAKFNKNPTKVPVDLDEEISNFKKDISIPIPVKEIDIRRVSGMKNKVMKFRKQLEKYVDLFSKCKDEMAYGGNVWRGIIKRPKVMTKNIDTEEYSTINNGIRQINRALDWIEKALIDLTSLTSKDLDTLNFINKVYVKNNIYEDAGERIVNTLNDVYDNLPDAKVAAKKIRSYEDPRNVDKPPVFSTTARKSSVPKYISDHHLVSRWGEEDSDDQNDNKEDPDDFVRPSAVKEEPSEHDSYDDNDEDTSNDTSSKPVSSTPPSVSNYYYYTYQNSLNKNQGSFNKTNDNSVDNRRIHNDSSTNNKDDHSHNVRNHRDDHSVTKSGDKTISMDINKKSSDIKDDDYHQMESVNYPWKLDLFNEAAAWRPFVESSDKYDGYKPVFVILKSYFTDKEREEKIKAANGDATRYFKDPFPIIHKATFGDNYGHAVISFDLEFKKSFEVFPVGLIRTKFDESWKGTKNLFIDAVFVTSDEYDAMINRCEYLIKNPSETSYGYSDLLKAFFSKPSKKANRALCSAFVSALLTDANPKNTHRDYQRMRPEDLEILPRSFHLVDSPNIDQYFEDLPDIKKKLDEIYEKHKSEIKEYNEELPYLKLKSQNDNLTKFDKTVDKVARKLLKVDETQSDKLQSDDNITEAAGDADNDRPKSDHPIKDALTDLDRATLKYQQAAKKGVQDASNVAKAASKPINRTKLWLQKVVAVWNDQNDTAMKERITNPKQRDTLFTAVRSAIKIGALAQVGLLWNPVVLFLTGRSFLKRKSSEFRLRNEIIGELKTEIAIVDEKINDARSKHDDKSKYQLMRLKNELRKKLDRVGGGKGMEKII